MKYEEITLNQLFRVPEVHHDKLQEFEIREKVVELKKKITKKEPRLKWRNVLDEILNSGNKLFNVRLKDVLENAWKKYDEIEKYLDTENFDTEETFLIPLARHTIISDHHPAVEIRLGEVFTGKIDFDLHLELAMSGILLMIKKGKIEGVKAGKCQSRGYFSCEGIPLFENESSEFEF